jgi:putative oxidoreductase
LFAWANSLIRPRGLLARVSDGKDLLIAKGDAAMLERLFATNRSRSLFLQRLVLGAVVLPHGLQKAFGWFGGFGFDGTMSFFTDTLGVPAPLGLLVILSDSLGSLALIAGLGTRLAALGTAATMLGAIFLYHLPNGFFMNWSGTQAGEGFEMHLLALALALPLVVRGGGAFAVDRVLARVATRGAAAGSRASSSEKTAYSA